MATADWVEIYRDESTDYLSGLKRKMLEEGEASYVSQNLGAKSYELAVGEFRDKLQAITRLLKERQSNEGDGAYHGRPDFSGLTGVS